MALLQTQNDFIKKSISIFGNQLDYSKVKYINSRNNIILICKEHGEFTIAPKDHISYKRGCSICSGVTYNTQTFIKKAKEIHGDKFLYNKTNYTGIKNNVIITCKLHGDFLQAPDKHINVSQGCPKCKKSAKKDLNYFIKMGTLIHSGKYDYSKSIFSKMNEKVIIICPKHGEFKQTPANHINHKQNCPACIVGKSKKEMIWLDSIGVPDDFSHRTVILHLEGKRLIVDGFSSATNTIYEFYGDYWHGNPKVYNPDDINDSLHMSYKDLYDKTIERENFLIKNGYKVISIWEKDFDEINNENKILCKLVN